MSEAEDTTPEVSETPDVSEAPEVSEASPDESQTGDEKMITTPPRPPDEAKASAIAIGGGIEYTPMNFSDADSMTRGQRARFASVVIDDLRRLTSEDPVFDLARQYLNEAKQVLPVKVE